MLFQLVVCMLHQEHAGAMPQGGQLPQHSTTAVLDAFSCRHTLNVCLFCFVDVGREPQYSMETNCGCPCMLRSWHGWLRERAEGCDVTSLSSVTSHVRQGRTRSTYEQYMQLAGAIGDARA